MIRTTDEEGELCPNPTLLQNHDGWPFQFFIKSCFDKPRLQHMIEAAGGLVTDVVGPYTITLAPPLMAFYGKEFDAFGYDFVLECVSRNSLLDLNLFRIGMFSKTFKPYNANDVLFQRLSWDEIPTLDSSQSIKSEKDVEAENDHLASRLQNDQSPHRKEDAAQDVRCSSPHLYSDGSEIIALDFACDVVISENYSLEEPNSNHEWAPGHNSECNGGNELETSFEQSSEKKQHTSKIHRSDSVRLKKKLQRVSSPKAASSPTPKRRDYTLQEKKSILDYIIKHGVFSKLKGNSMWQEMANSEYVEGRTWQSLKEHFRKKIYPNLHLYQLSKTEFNLFRSGMTQ